MNILESNLGWMRFYHIRDRDYLPETIADKYRGHSSGRVFVLGRYHIENYLIVPDILSIVLRETYGKSVSGTQIAEDLRDIAVSMTGEVGVGNGCVPPQPRVSLRRLNASRLVDGSGLTLATLAVHWAIRSRQAVGSPPAEAFTGNPRGVSLMCR